jgi:hypothetical protein
MKLEGRVVIMGEMGNDRKTCREVGTSEGVVWVRIGISAGI